MSADLRPLVEKVPGLHKQDADEWRFDCPVNPAHGAYYQPSQDALWCDEGCTEAGLVAGVTALAETVDREVNAPPVCPEASDYRHDSLACVDCMVRRTWARDEAVRRTAARAVVERSMSWGRIDLLNVPAPQPATVGEVAEGKCLFHRGRRHVLYGDGETGKSWVGYIVAGQEVSRGMAAVVLNGEMADEDVADWVRNCDPSPGEEDVGQGLFVYPAAGLLDVEQRRTILSDISASGRELSFVFVDSQTSVLSQAGLNPNKSEDVERLWEELGGWFIGLPSSPAFVMSDHVSKGADGATPTGSIRKRNVVDTAFHVENPKPFSPETPHGRAVSGYSTVTITKGRRGGRGLVVARIVGHEGRVSLCSPRSDLPWVKAGQPLVGPVPSETLTILREVAREEGRGTEAVVQALPFGQSEGYRLMGGLAVDEKEAGPGALLIRQQRGRSKVPVLTDRGREVLRQAEESTSTSTSTRG